MPVSPVQRALAALSSRNVGLAADGRDASLASTKPHSASVVRLVVSGAWDWSSARGRFATTTCSIAAAASTFRCTSIQAARPSFSAMFGRADRRPALEAQERGAGSGESERRFLLPLYPAPRISPAGGSPTSRLDSSHRHGDARHAVPERRAGRPARDCRPWDIFDYAYAVFHSPAYRRRYAEFLKTDFPRLPMTSNANLFRTLAACGAELVALHLLESPKIGHHLVDWPDQGDNVVQKVRIRKRTGGSGSTARSTSAPCPWRSGISMSGATRSATNG